MEASQGTEARAAGDAGQEQAVGEKITAVLRKFHAALGDALDRGLSPPEIVSLFGEVQNESRRLLEEVGDATGVGGGVIGGMVLARDVEAVLLNQHGWLEVAPGTMRSIAGKARQTGWLSFETTTTILTGTGANFGGKRLLVPLADVSGMRVPPEALGEGAQPPDSDVAPAPVPVEGGGPKEGDRVRVHGGKGGVVVAPPDSEGKVPVQIDFGEIEVFTPEEVQPEEPPPPEAVGPEEAQP